MATIDAGDPSPEATDTEALIQRMELFRMAHALVNGLTWGEGFGVYDVLKVVQFLEDKKKEEE